ncbi:MAG: hypothetical protein HYZ29_12375 [Myxococcales bacterium]|nr:hypothetical protein [Myxococcales bacterium]
MTRSTRRSNLPALVAKPLAFGALVLLAAGCALGGAEDDGKSSAAAQGTPHEGEAGAAGASAGGSGGAAGAETGGAAGTAATASGGSSGAAGAGGSEQPPPPVCKEGEKLCSTGCAAIGPENGCGSVGCSPCNTPPANSKGTCDGALCDFECLPGFARKGFACVAEGTGGTGGSGGGTGGSGAGGAGGSSGSSSGGTGGGLQICVAPCKASESSSQLLCMAACMSKGGAGLCAPALNCCVCGN